MNMKKMFFFLLLALIATKPAFSQDDEGEKRKGRILDKIKKIIEAKEQRILEEIEQFLDKKLNKTDTTSTDTSGKPFIGFLPQGIGDDELEELQEANFNGGVKISQIIPDSPAEKHGLKPGDILVKYNSTNIESPADLIAAISRNKIGDKVELSIYRDSQISTINLVLGNQKSRHTETVNEDDDESESIEELKETIEQLKKRVAKLENENAKLRKEPQGRNGTRNPRKDTPEPVPQKSKPYIGIQIEELSDSETAAVKKLSHTGGLKITEIDKNSPAEKAKLAINDIIVKINGTAVESHEDVEKIVKALKPQDSITIDIVRAGQAQSVKLTVGTGSNR